MLRKITFIVLFTVLLFNPIVSDGVNNVANKDFSGTYTVLVLRESWYPEQEDDVWGFGTYSIPKVEGKGEDEVLREILLNYKKYSKLVFVVKIKGIPIQDTKWKSLAVRYYDEATEKKGLPILPGYEEATSQDAIALITYSYHNSLTSKLVHSTWAIYNQPGMSDDEAIIQSLEIERKGMTWVNQDYYSITHINGIPIEKTKWANYGGLIMHPIWEQEF